MTEYKIVKRSLIEGLEKEVNKLVSEGWRLQGGVAIFLSGGTFFLQAVVRDTTNAATPKPVLDGPEYSFGGKK